MMYNFPTAERYTKGRGTKRRSEKNRAKKKPRVKAIGKRKLKLLIHFTFTLLEKELKLLVLKFSRIFSLAKKNNDFFYVFYCDRLTSRNKLNFKNFLT